MSLPGSTKLPAVFGRPPEGLLQADTLLGAESLSTPSQLLDRRHQNQMHDPRLTPVLPSGHRLILLLCVHDLFLHTTPNHPNTSSTRINPTRSSSTYWPFGPSTCTVVEVDQKKSDLEGKGRMMMSMSNAFELRIRGVRSLEMSIMVIYDVSLPEWSGTTVLTGDR